MRCGGGGVARQRANSGELIMRRYQNGDYETTSMYDAADAADDDEMDAFDDELPLAPPGGGGERFQQHDQSYRMLRRASSSLLM